MHNQIPMLNVDLHIAPDFSGRLMLYVENGVVKGETSLKQNEIIGTPELFSEILKRAGYCIVSDAGYKS